MTPLSGRSEYQRRKSCLEYRRRNKYKNIVALAALAHAAYYRVSDRPDFKTISRIIYEATATIASGNSWLEDMAKARLKSIRYHFLIFRYGKMAGRFLALLERLLKGE